MRLFAFISNISLTLALVANRSSLPSQQLGRQSWRTPHITPKAVALPSSVVLHPSSSTLCTSCDARGRYNTALQATAVAASNSSSSNGKRQTIIATTLLILLDIQFRSLFLKYSIAFPSSLAGCGALFASMLLLTSVNEELGEGVYGLLNPGATLLAKWLPVFFVPSLITLPLASGLGDAWEVSFMCLLDACIISSIKH